MILKSLTKLVTLGVTAVFLTSTAQAEWSLVNDSSTLSFVTIKADHVGEVHTFDLMAGSIDDDGTVEIVVELASVNTLIDIRNERMQNMLFETSIFPEARITGNIDVAAVTAMSTGSTQAMQIPFELDIHGETNSYNALLNKMRGTYRFLTNFNLRKKSKNNVAHHYDLKEELSNNGK